MENVITLKCSSCGAEVVMDIRNTKLEKCPWCRNTLLLNEQIQNGSMPNLILPFSIAKEDAKKIIDDFLNRKKFFLHPKFIEEFTMENIVGVYFPYILMDINSYVDLKGQGEKLIKRYTRGIGNNEETFYDADLFKVERLFDLVVHDLNVLLDSKTSLEKDNNIINTLMPFDIENCVAYNINYLNGCISEKLDINIEHLNNTINRKLKNIARSAINETLEEYDRGIFWNTENITTREQQLKIIYLPVWVYSYQEISDNKKDLHYIAVNARTKKVMGHLPIYYPKLIGISFVIEVIGILFALFTRSKYNSLFLLSGFLIFTIFFLKYRNKDTNNYYEREVKKEIFNLNKVDTFMTKRVGLSKNKIEGFNNTPLSDEGILDKMVSSISTNNLMSQIMNNTKDKK